MPLAWCLWYSPNQQMHTAASQRQTVQQNSNQRDTTKVRKQADAYLTDMRYAMASESSSKSDSWPCGTVVASSLPKTYFCPQVGSMPEFWCCRSRCFAPCFLARLESGSEISPSDMSSYSRLTDIVMRVGTAEARGLAALQAIRQLLMKGGNF